MKISNIISQALPASLHTGRVCFFLLTTSVILLHSCNEPPATPGEQASAAAKEYYEMLVDGRTTDYVAGVYGSDTIYSEYRDQLIANASLFMETQQNKHGGIKSVRIIRTDLNDSRTSATVFLMLCFGNGFNEQVVVPMVKNGERWMMK